MHTAYTTLIKALDWYDAHIARVTDVPCSGDILCQRSGKRHRNGCMGRTEPFATYARKVVQ